MSTLIQPIQKPVLWWDMVSPCEEDMPEFLKLAGRGWRTPKRKWEDLWRLQRGQFNSVLGLRRFRGLKFQRGIVIATAVYPLAANDPALTNIAHVITHTAPQAVRQQYAYDSDGGMRHDLDATIEGSITYTDLTTQTDDTNDHTNEWWPDQPDTNEGLNWDIRYLNFVDAGPRPLTASHLLADNTGTNRVSGTWYLLDTISNDHVDGSHDGGIGCNHSNGTEKNPSGGNSIMTVDVEIRVTGSGSAIASHSYDLDVNGE